MIWREHARTMVVDRHMVKHPGAILGMRGALR